MLKNELYKAWSKPLTRTVFLIVCLVQILYVPVVAVPASTELVSACNEMGGAMDETWQNTIQAMYESNFQGAAPEDYWNLSSEDKAILLAEEYTAFTDMLDQYTESLKSVYGEKAEQAYSKLRAASESGGLVFGLSSAGVRMVDQSILSWSYLIFMILFSADLFSGERSANMMPLQAVTRNGRKKMFWVKGTTCQLSAAFVWIAANLCYGLSLTFFCGWGDLKSVVQDFSYNFCPYNWNIGQFLTVNLLTGFAASQVTAAIQFLLACTSRNITSAFARMSGILVLPYFLACVTKNPWLSLWVPCLMNGQWLWSDLHLLKVGNVCINLWCIAGAELILAFGTAEYFLRRMTPNCEESYYEI
jgi:hypothetical protein